MDINEESKALSVVCILPTYNEKDTIERVINSIFRLQDEVKNFRLKVLVVDDMSPDGTGDTVFSLMKKHKNLSLIQGKKVNLM